MEILAEECHNRLVMIECFADHCATTHGFANVVVDILDEFPDVVFFQINKMDRYNGHKMFECLKVGKFRDPYTKYKTPTYMFFRNGDQIDEVVGANQPEIQRVIKKHLAWDPNAPDPDSDSEDETAAASDVEVVEDDDQE